MASRIYKAVANPTKFLFAPMLPAAANMGLCSLLMMFSQVVLPGTNPLLFIILAIGGHFGLIAWGFKEPHLSSVMQSRGQGARSTRNMIKVKGFKSKYVA